MSQSYQKDPDEENAALSVICDTCWPPPWLADEATRREMRACGNMVCLGCGCYSSAVWCFTCSEPLMAYVTVPAK